MNRLLLLCLTATLLLSACASDVRPLLPSDDCGPKPKNPQAIAAAWFNAHYTYTPPTPLQPSEFSVSEPTKVATQDLLLGRIVGWQIILGPENKNVTYFTGYSETRLVVNRDRIVSVTSSDTGF